MTNKNFIYGIHAVTEAIKANKKIEKVFLRKESQSQQFADLFRLIRQKNIVFQFVPQQKLDKITTNNHQGVIAFMQIIEYVDFEQFVDNLFTIKNNPLFILLDGVTDVRNLGSIARSAECAGVDLLVVRQAGSAQINHDTIKTSAGALLRLPVAKVKSLPNAIDYLKKKQVNIVAATEKAQQTIYDIDFTIPTAIVLGDEEKGISYNVIKISNYKARIPIFGQIASLNVANASSIIVFEALRQRLSQTSK